MLLFLLLFFLIPYIHTSCSERNTRKRAKKNHHPFSNQPTSDLTRVFVQRAQLAPTLFRALVSSTAQNAAPNCLLCSAVFLLRNQYTAQHHTQTPNVLIPMNTAKQSVSEALSSSSFFPICPPLSFTVPLCRPPFCVSLSADVNILKIKIEAFVPVAQMMMFNVVFFHKMLGEIIKS